MQRQIPVYSSIKQLNIEWTRSNITGTGILYRYSGTSTENKDINRIKVILVTAISSIGITQLSTKMQLSFSENKKCK